MRCAPWPANCPHPAVPARPRKRGSPRSPREKERTSRRVCNSTVKRARIVYEKPVFPCNIPSAGPRGGKKGGTGVMGHGAWGTGVGAQGSDPVLCDCVSRRKERRALRGSYVAEDVFQGFITVAPLTIHSGPLQPRPEWGGMLEPGGVGPRPERSFRPRLFRAPAGRHQSSDDGRSIARVGYEAGDRIVPSRRPGAGAFRLVRARSPDPPLLCDRRLRPSARHLETYGRANGGVWGPSPNESVERRGLETLAERNAEWRGLETLAQRNKFATKAVGIRGRSRPTLQHATLTLPPVYDL